MYQLRRAAGRPPILVLCGYDLRAADRARALRSGADDFISGGLNPEEVASRIQALLRRGRAITNGVEGGDELAPGGQALAGPNHANVREIVRRRLQGAGAAIFSLVLLRPVNGSALEDLATHVAGRMRQNSGDRMALTEERVEVYLEGALAIHAERFLSRVRTAHWDKIAAVVYTSPTDREELLKLVDQQDG